MGGVEVGLLAGPAHELLDPLGARTEVEGGDLVGGCGDPQERHKMGGTSPRSATRVTDPTRRRDTGRHARVSCAPERVRVSDTLTLTPEVGRASGVQGTHTEGSW